jgi:predicted RNA-binding protein with PIN domain
MKKKLSKIIAQSLKMEKSAFSHNLDNTEKMQEHLIIDGNNALHAIPQLAKTLTIDRQVAREDLIRMLEPLQGKKNCLLTVVFDGRGGKTSLSTHRNNPDYSIIYSSSSQGADGVIERMLMGAEYPDRITVGTNDSLIRNCAYTHGAAVMRVEELVKKLDASIDLSRSIKSNKKKNEEKFENRIPFPRE